VTQVDGTIGVGQGAGDQDMSLLCRHDSLLSPYS
jgi:hypothetical protein